MFIKPNIRFWLACALLLTAMSPVATAQQKKKDERFSDLIKHVKHAVVIITTYDCQGQPLLHGNGFFVEANRLITDRHVLSGSCQVRIKTFDGKTYPVQGLVAVNEQRDLALLQAAVPSSRITTLTVEGVMPREGEEIIVVSNPEGLSWNVLRGTTLPNWDFQSVGKVIRITSSIHPGSSGSPVVNRYGRVIGVAAMQVKSAEELNFALPGEWVAALQSGPLKSLAIHALSK